MNRSVDTPPYSPENERSVIASMMLDNSTIDDVIALGLRTDDFLSLGCRTIFPTIIDLWRSGRPADTLTVATRLSEIGKLDAAGGTPGIQEILEAVPHAAHARYYAENVRNFSGKRELLTLARELAHQAAESADKPEEIAAAAESRLHRIIERDAGNGSVSVQQALQELQATWDSGTTPGITTGFDGLNELLDGGFRPGTLNILGARPSVGKTAVAVGITLNIVRTGQPVLFVALEQSRLELMERFVASLANISVKSLRDQRHFGAESRAKLRGAVSMLRDLPISITDNSYQTVAQINAQSRLHKRRQGLGLLVVDYLQLLQPEDRKAPREQQVASNARGLKLLARDLEIPVLCLAQLNRAVEGRESKRPRLSDLRESGAIEQDADLVMFLDRPGAHDTNARPDQATLIIAKNRHGATGDVPLSWNGPTMTYHEADDGGFPI